MTLCTRCHNIHDDAHVTKMLRFEVVQWMPKLKNIAHSATCRHCANEAKIRIQCKECNVALCRACFDYLDRRSIFFNKHQTDHPDDRAFVSVYPPHWRKNQTWKLEQGCLCVDLFPGFMDHCERCHDGQKCYSSLT
jgi:hypothetical protein